MQRSYVVSSRIWSVGWENNVLEVQFRDGAVYQYYNVSEAEYRWFISSPSLGRALSVIDKHHGYRRVG